MHNTKLKIILHDEAAMTSSIISCWQNQDILETKIKKKKKDYYKKIEEKLKYLELSDNSFCSQYQMKYIFWNKKLIKSNTI